MYPLFESIKVVDGKIINSDWHQMRYERSFNAHYNKSPIGTLIGHITIPENVQSGVYKLRISYNDQFKKIEFKPYQIMEIKTIKIIEANDIIYDLKYTDRNALHQAFNQRGSCDDVLIIKNGAVTDSSFANIVFFDGEEWLTPSSPLLEGTARARLLKEGYIKERNIMLNDINSYNSFKLINALRDFNQVESLDIDSIKR